MPIENGEQFVMELQQIAEKFGFTGFCCAFYNESSMEIAAAADPLSATSVAKTETIRGELSNIALHVFRLDGIVTHSRFYK